MNDGKNERDAIAGYERYGFSVLRNGNRLDITMTSETAFTEEETVRAVEWLLFERKLAMREEILEERIME